MNASVTQVQLQLALAAVGNYNRFLGQRKTRDTLVGAGQEDPFPMSGGGVNVIDVENHLGKAFVEDARGDLIGSLAGAQAVFDAPEFANGKRSEPEGHRKGNRSSSNSDHADRNQQSPAAHAQRAHGDQLTVG